jgi:hypothetical protein
VAQGCKQSTVGCSGGYGYVCVSKRTCRFYTIIVRISFSFDLELCKFEILLCEFTLIVQVLERVCMKVYHNLTFDPYWGVIRDDKNR